MGKISETALELLNQAYDAGKLNLLLAQLQKDYDRSNLSFPLVLAKEGDRISTEYFLELLRENLYFLLMERFDQYLNLMYSADVPERDFRGIEPTDAVEVAQQVAFLLLRREWQKVCMRDRYGSASAD